MMSVTLFEVSPMGRRDSTGATRKSSWVSIKPFIWGTPEQAQKNCPLIFLFSFTPSYQVNWRRTIRAL
jgi:hypothetical protein